jgi:hypothetical protein
MSCLGSTDVASREIAVGGDSNSGGGVRCVFSDR